VYPASFSYPSSVRAGITALKARLTQTASRCAGITFVLIGYSQGAQVIGDTLAAGAVPAAGRIKAVVFFGDPRFNGREPFDIGSYNRNRNGIFPPALGALNAFAGAIGSYCRVDDTVCQSGASGLGHFRYAADRPAAVAFVRGELA
jgi:Cutinase